MKVNRLIQEILKGEWFIHPMTLQNYKPLVANLLEGKSVGNLFSPEDQEEPSCMYYVNAQGQKVTAENLTEEQDVYAVVKMVGPVIKYGDMCTWGADEIVQQLYVAEQLPGVKGTILYIDGPGGSTSAIGPFQEFAKNKTKPVVALCDMTCSLHYWTAVAVADHIMADNDVSALFGSVGVVCSFADEKPYWEAKGIKFHEIYPDESKHKNEVYRLALEGKYDQIKKEHLSPLAQKFQEAVRSNRPNLKEEVGVVTGKTFSADKALELGMIDSIGSMRQAVNILNMLSELKIVTQ